jgi:hypothetical protein
VDNWESNYSEDTSLWCERPLPISGMDGAAAADKKPGSSWHGASQFSASFDGDGQPTPGGTPWTVHDGKFFSDAFGSGEGRAPNERKLLMPQMQMRQPLLREDDRRRLRQMGVKPSAIERLGQRTVELMLTGTSGVIVPEHLKGLGGTVAQIDSFKVEGLLGFGSFAVVQKAHRHHDGKPCAIKIFNHPVRPPQAEASSDSSVHGVSKGSDPRVLPSSEYDAADAKSFVREVAILAQSRMAHPSIVQYAGHGFVQTGESLWTHLSYIAHIAT